MDYVQCIIVTSLNLGIPFTKECKPQFCAQLKAQLDQYLIVGDSKDYGAISSSAGGQTLGSAAQIQEHLLKTTKSKIC